MVFPLIHLIPHIIPHPVWGLALESFLIFSCCGHTLEGPPPVSHLEFGSGRKCPACRRRALRPRERIGSWGPLSVHFRGLGISLGAFGAPILEPEGGPEGSQNGTKIVKKVN